MRPARVLYLHHTSGFGGLEKNLVYLLRGLDRERFHPLILLPSTGKLHRELKNLGVQVRLGDVQWIRRTWNPRTLVNYLRSLREGAASLAALIESEGVALVHTSSYTAQLYGGVAGRRAGVPVLWHVHDILKMDALNRRLLRFNARHATAIIAVSEAVRKHLVEHGVAASQCVTVYNGVDLAEHSPKTDGEAFRREWGIPATAFVAGIVGRLAPFKGHRVFLEAAGRIASENPETKFVVIGDALFGEDRYKQDLLKQAHDWGLHDRVLFTGFRDDIASVMASLDVVVFPSLIPESFGRVLIEAMALGKPVIATTLGAPAEIVVEGETGFLVRPDDVNRLAEHIRFLMTHADLRRQMGLAARRRAETRFSLERFVKGIEAEYERVLHGRR